MMLTGIDSSLLMTFVVTLITLKLLLISSFTSAQQQSPSTSAPPPTQTQAPIAPGEQATMSLRITMQLEVSDAAVASGSAASGFTAGQLGSILISAAQQRADAFVAALSSDIRTIAVSVYSVGSAVRINAPIASVRAGSQGTVSSDLHFYSLTGIASLDLKSQLDSLVSTTFLACTASSVKLSCDNANSVYNERFGFEASRRAVSVKILSFGSASGGGNPAPSAVSDDGICIIDGNCGVTYFVYALFGILILVCLRLSCKCMCRESDDDNNNNADFGTDSNGNPISSGTSSSNRRRHDDHNHNNRPNFNNSGESDDHGGIDENFTDVIVKGADSAPNTNSNDNNQNTKDTKDTKERELITPEEKKQREAREQKESVAKLKEQLRQEILREQREKQQQKQKHQQQKGGNDVIIALDASPNLSRIGGDDFETKNDRNRDQQNDDEDTLDGDDNHQEMSVLKSNPFSSPVPHQMPTKNSANNNNNNSNNNNNGNKPKANQKKKKTASSYDDNNDDLFAQASGSDGGGFTFDL